MTLLHYPRFAVGWSRRRLVLLLVLLHLLCDTPLLSVKGEDDDDAAVVMNSNDSPSLVVVDNNNNKKNDDETAPSSSPPTTIPPLTTTTSDSDVQPIRRIESEQEESGGHSHFHQQQHHQHQHQQQQRLQQKHNQQHDQEYHLYPDHDQKQNRQQQQDSVNNAIEDSTNESSSFSNGPSSAAANKRLWGAGASMSSPEISIKIPSKMTVDSSSPVTTTPTTTTTMEDETTTTTAQSTLSSSSSSSLQSTSHVRFIMKSASSSSQATATATTEQQSSSNKQLPKPKSQEQHPPPEGFVISARVYIDAKDKLAHVDREEDGLTIPYWHCGVAGSTTSPIAVKDATFRHSLTPTTSWTTTATTTTFSDGTHPLVVIALSPLTIETNSGESTSIQAGEAFLLEDGLLPGHKLMPRPHQALQVLYLTIKQTHYHPGKEKFQFHAAATTTFKSSSLDPCSLPSWNMTNSSSGADGDGSLDWNDPSLNTRRRRRAQYPPYGNVRRRTTTANILRKSLFGLVGLSFSTLVADFFSKTAPLWLAVGVGGTCFVVGGTTLAIVMGERFWTTLEVWFEQERLRTKAVVDNVPPIGTTSASSSTTTPTTTATTQSSPPITIATKPTVIVPSKTLNRSSTTTAAAASATATNHHHHHHVLRDNEENAKETA